MNSRVPLLLLLLAGALLGPGAAHAQFIPQPLSLAANPSAPSPGETVVVNAHTPLFEEATAFFRWQVNGIARPDLSGYGKSEFSLVTGEVGSMIRINLEVSHKKNGVSRATLSIYVNDVALVWAADTYRPKWFTGKALPTKNATVVIAAIPFITIGGVSIPSERLIYTWGVDAKEAVETGMGKDVFRITMADRFNAPSRIRVSVADIDQRVRKDASVLIRPVEPKLLLYPYLPLGGVEYRAEAAAIAFFPRTTMDFLLEPLYAFVARKEDLSYSWAIAGKEVSGEPPLPYLITLDATGHKDPFIPLVATVMKKGGVPFSTSHTFTLNLLP